MTSSSHLNSSVHDRRQFGNLGLGDHCIQWDIHVGWVTAALIGVTGY